MNHPDMLTAAALDELIDRVLGEDLGGGDLTTECCIDAAQTAVGEALARRELVVCGGAVFARVFERVDPATKVEIAQPDGAKVAAETLLWRVRGRACSLLSAERVALNFAQHLTGIATLTRRYVDALPPDSRTRITDTRKTTPGLRALERYAVHIGGAHNHRDDLGSGVMIKDNHIVAAGGIPTAMQRARRLAPHTTRIEVEVTTLEELAQALEAGADIVMLDNMDTPTVARAVAHARSHARAGATLLLEASGGVSLERVSELASAGVDVISVGALTHSAPAANISFELVSVAHPRSIPDPLGAASPQRPSAS
jgi:nicotinate-nucleotide pyrophosphorylase (carboxylating)